MLNKQVNQNEYKKLPVNYFPIKINKKPKEDN